MDSQKLQVAERIKAANNILVTVSGNPSVDQLSACIGLTLALNKLNKHATAVFSGPVPSTIEFLQPEKTIEKNTDSLRDFIIALDKSKADKLRYKVEDKVVKIFITPYRTSISENDLEFSQGDFNVDVVVALGVHEQNDLDQAITAHGRILHDATVVTVNNRPGGELGNINWVNPQASSLAELAAELADALDKKLIDNQIATAFLTGIVAETDRFSNEKTTPQTMSISAALMAAGANQQLVATKLEEPVAPPPAPASLRDQGGETEPEPTAKKSDDGTLEITHEKTADNGEKTDDSKKSPQPSGEEPKIDTPQISIDEHGSFQPLGEKEEKSQEAPASAEPAEKEAVRSKPPEEPTPHTREHTGGPHMVLQPPTFDSQLTAAAKPTGFPGEPPMSLPQVEPEGPLLDREPLQTPSIAPPLKPPADTNEPFLGKPRDFKLPGDEDASDASKPTTDTQSNGLPPIVKPTMSTPDNSSSVNPSETPSRNSETLSDIERDVHSTHLGGSPEPQSQTPAGPSNGFMPPISSAPASPFGTTSTQGTPGSFPPVRSPGSSPTLSSAPDTAINNSSMPQDAGPAANVTNARDAVNQAISGASASLDPIQSLNAQSLGTPLHENNQPASGEATTPAMPEAPPANPRTAFNPAAFSSQPDSSAQPDIPIVPPQPSPGTPPGGPHNDANAQGGTPPPPVPPPMLPPTPPFGR